MPWFANIWFCCTVQRLGMAIICALVSGRKPSQTKGMVSILFLCAFVGKNRRLKNSFLGVSWMAISTQKVHHSQTKRRYFFSEGKQRWQFLQHTKLAWAVQAWEPPPHSWWSCEPHRTKCRDFPADHSPRKRAHYCCVWLPVTWQIWETWRGQVPKAFSSKLCLPQCPHRKRNKHWVKWVLKQKNAIHVIQVLNLPVFKNVQRLNPPWHFKSRQRDPAPALWWQRKISNCWMPWKCSNKGLRGQIQILHARCAAKFGNLRAFIFSSSIRRIF